MNALVEKTITLEQVEVPIKQLPLLASVLFEFLRSDPNTENFIHEMVKLAKSDLPLASLIIGYVNSRACSRNQYVDGIESALTRIGSNTILQLIMAISVTSIVVHYHHNIDAINHAKVSQEWGRFEFH